MLKKTDNIYARTNKFY